MNYMNKSILIVKTPDNCSQCNFCTDFRGCLARHVIVTEDEYNKERSEWCPLKEFPERSNTQQGTYELDEYCSGYDDGWNELRKEILAGTIYEKIETDIFDEEENISND